MTLFHKYMPLPSSCDCCDCVCCPCLEGMWLTVSNFISLECSCDGFNQTVYVPNLRNIPTYMTTAAAAAYADAAECYESGWQEFNFGEYDCGIFTVKAEIAWIVVCNPDGSVFLSVYLTSRNVNSAESFNATWEELRDGCDDLTMDKIVSCNDGRVFEDYCDCSELRLQTAPEVRSPCNQNRQPRARLTPRAISVSENTSSSLSLGQMIAIPKRLKLGDAVEAALTRVGITEGLVRRWLGGCNCEQRKKKLNLLDDWASQAAVRGKLAARRLFEKITGIEEP